MEPKNRFQGTNSARLCSLVGRYENPIPTRFLAPYRLFKNSSTGCREAARKLKMSDPDKVSFCPHFYPAGADNGGAQLFIATVSLLSNLTFPVQCRIKDQRPFEFLQENVLCSMIILFREMCHQNWRLQ